jgi:hypothetical protein
MKRNILSEVIALLIVVLFLYTGFSKLWNFPVFRLQLSQSPFHLLSSLSDLVAWTLPAGEIMLACLLLWPRVRKAGFILSAVLFGIFTSYLLVLLNSGSRLPCSCGGIVSFMGWEAHVYFNIGFLLLSIVGIYLERKKVPRHNELQQSVKGMAAI